MGVAEGYLKSIVMSMLIDEDNNSLNVMILKVASETIHYRVDPKDRVIAPWWNSECDKVLKKTKQVFKALPKNPTQKNIIF